MNAFNDTPQMSGGHQQQTAHPFVPVAAFAIYSGMNAGDRDAEISVLWLKAFGARAVTVPGPASTDPYKPFAHPAKFNGVLPLLWRQDDIAIYDVPVRSKSLAHVVPLSALVSRVPENGLDVKEVEPYVNALEDPAAQPAFFEWKNWSRAAIQALVPARHAVSVQVTYARGWEAYADGRRQKLRDDGLGQIVIEPDCSSCSIDLQYTGGSERTVTRALSILACLTALGYGIVQKTSKARVRV